MTHIDFVVVNFSFSKKKVSTISFQNRACTKFSDVGYRHAYIKKYFDCIFIEIR